MKTQLQKPSAGKARYTPEYKQQALEQWRLSGRSAARVAAELGIRAPLLYRWARQRRVAAAAAGEPEFTQPEIERMDAEIRRLKEENAKLLEQREVLKKSLGILCEPPARGTPKSSG